MYIVLFYKYNVIHYSGISTSHNIKILFSHEKDTNSFGMVDYDPSIFIIIFNTILSGPTPTATARSTTTLLLLATLVFVTIHKVFIGFQRTNPDALASYLCSIATIAAIPPAHPTLSPLVHATM